MGMLIRVAFNNQNWANTCKNPVGHQFKKCRDQAIDTKYGLDSNGNCTDKNCWESKLCSQYCWHSIIGNFGKRAQGTVFFVFPDTNNSLVLWGRSEVDRVEGKTVYFKAFKPLPSDRWVRNLCSKDILGKNFGRGTYRYLNGKQERSLNNLIKPKMCTLS